MPKVVKTVRDTAGSSLNTLIMNWIKATSAVIGSDYVQGGTLSGKTIYYIKMDNLGFQNWCIVFLNGGTLVEVGTAKYDSSGPNVSDPNFLVETWNRSLVGMDSEGYPVTAVMVRDSGNNTVLLNIHNGTTETGIDISENGNLFSANCSVFFAKDVDEGVLSAVGWGAFDRFRTEDNSVNLKQGSEAAIKQFDDVSNVLHVTKMVNYLSPNYPEMKSAYVAVVRPKTPSSQTSGTSVFNPSYYSDGNVWYGVGSVINGGGTNTGYSRYFPMDPLIKY